MIDLDIPRIQTQRLVLRGLREDDLDAFAAMMADERVYPWFGGGAVSRAESWRSIAMHLGHWALRGYGQWAVEDRDTGSFLGRLGLWEPEGWPGLEVGWAIAPQMWGRGYATEGGRAATAWAFQMLGAQEVISVTVPHNAASRRVMEKVGLRYDRTQEIGGHEQVVYVTTPDVWASDG